MGDRCPPCGHWACRSTAITCRPRAKSGNTGPNISLAPTPPCNRRESRENRPTRWIGKRSERCVKAIVARHCITLWFNNHMVQIYVADPAVEPPGNSDERDPGSRSWPKASGGASSRQAPAVPRQCGQCADMGVNRSGRAQGCVPSARETKIEQRNEFRSTWNSGRGLARVRERSDDRSRIRGDRPRREGCGGGWKPAN